MLYLWTVLGTLFVTGAVWGQMYNASACFGTDPDCSFMNLTCSDSRRIFILKMLFGSKTSNSSCFQNSTCAALCCEAEESDCFSNYTDLTFASVYENHHCWNNSSCRSQAANGPTPCAVYPAVSTYAIAHYSCLGSNDLTVFNSSTKITAPAVAIHYDYTDENSYPVASSGTKTWHCQVDTADCVQRQADVILVKENETENPAKCSSVGWNGGHFLPCNTNLRYLSFGISTPFCVSLEVEGKRRDPNGWAVVRAQDGSNLTVQCGYTNLTVIPNCTASASSTPSTAPPATTTPPTLTTQESSQNTDTPTSSTTLTSTVVTTTSSTSRDSSTMYMTSSSAPVQPGNASPVSNTGAVAGGVVAAVVVLVAAVLAVFCFLKRRTQKPGAESKSARIRKSSLRMPLTSVTSGGAPSPRPSESGISNVLDVADGDYDRIGQEPQHSDGNPIVHGLPVKPRSAGKEPDYDLLGQKKSQSSSSNPAAPYGRLGEVGGGGENTDYNYDHLARGRQAAPDVINSDYDTSALHVTSEGDYNVAGIPKKQHVITGSDYDVAQIVTSEGDYNKVDFQGKKQHVITGSDYDSAEIVTSDGDYNRVDFQGKKQRVITGPDYDSAEIVTSDGDYNRVDFQGNKQKVVTGSEYNIAEVTTDNAESDDIRPGTSAPNKVGGGNYDLAKPVEP